VIWNAFFWIFLFISVFYIFSGLDDLWIDGVAWCKRLFPHKLGPSEKGEILHLRERRIAILVAAWKEEGVISEMIRGNCENLQYANYDFFLGVYPNDRETLLEAQQLAQEFQHVHVVVNSQFGPTSKGQMLNEIVAKILDSGSYPIYELLMIHDAEDIIHPFSLKIVNWRSRFSDFVQIPVFSLPTSPLNIVAGLYADEFAESHTKDVLVRQHLGAPIPSAGVGTAMTKKYVQRLRRKQQGSLFNPETVTEDYQLGLCAESIGLSTEFACYFQDSSEGRDFIATREYFPKKFSASVRQRSRWILGIAFQGYKALGWKGSAVHRYFLFRDRKGPFSSMISFAGLLILVPSFFYLSHIPEANRLPFLTLTYLNLALAGNRILQRFSSTRRIYGLSATGLIVPRILVGNIINAFATCRATVQHARYILQGKAPAWAKTSHEMPVGFGSRKVIPLRLQNLPVWAALSFLLFSSSIPVFAGKHVQVKARAEKSICLFYDKIEDQGLSNQNDAVMMLNLLGHFKNQQISFEPVQTYQSGRLKACDALIYMGGVFDVPLSEEFLTDLSHYSKSTLWIGYNIWKLEDFLGTEKFLARYGFSYQHTEGLHRTGAEVPFYQFYSYKGETFEKAQAQGGSGAADPSIVIVTNQDAKIISEATQTRTGQKTPYVLKKNNFYYVADRGFSYIHEADRYLIIADLLFDFLAQPAQAGPHQALVRLEDVSANSDLPALQKTLKVLNKRKVPFGISLIPKFMSELAPDGTRQVLTISDRPDFRAALNQAQSQGGTLLLHGFTHQVDGIPNCPALTSGLDYEFWDRCHGGPLSFDSEDFVRNRLNAAFDILKSNNLSVAAWVTPHYSASPLDYRIFAQVFNWTLQRVIYVVDGDPNPDFSNSQFFPYTIYKDYYGQKVLPENLGYQGEGPAMAWAQRVVRNAKRNLVIRDSWASLFWHPYLGADPESLQALDYVLQNLQKQGYVFTDLRKGKF
jgi:adsorption protein B